MVEMLKDNSLFKKVKGKVEELKDECYKMEADKSHKDAARVRSL